MDNVLTGILPHLMEIASVILTAIIGWAAAQARKKWGIEIEAKHRDALHSALMTGAQLALRHQLTGTAAIDLVVRYIKESVPDATRALSPPPGLLEDMAKAKLEALAAGK